MLRKGYAVPLVAFSGRSQGPWTLVDVSERETMRLHIHVSPI